MTTDIAADAILSESASLAALREATVGRLAVVVDGRPGIFPVNFVVDHGCVVFRTAAGTKLAAAVGQPVAFEADGYDASSGEAWSVVVKGTAHEISAYDDVIAALALPLSPWHSVAKPRLVRIDRESITGRRFPVELGRRAIPARRVAPE